MPATHPIRSWVLPGEPAPVRLTSTIWPGAEGIHDDLAGPADLDAWLDAVGIDCHGAKATEDELRSAIRLRDAVRRLAAYATGDDRPAAASAIADLDEAVTVLNEHAAKLPPPAIAAGPSGLRRAKEEPASDLTPTPYALPASANRLWHSSKTTGMSFAPAARIGDASSTSSRATPAANGAPCPAATAPGPHGTTTKSARAARGQSVNRLIKTDARCAYGYRNPANQRLRARAATTRGARGHLATRTSGRHSQPRKNPRP